MSGHIVLKGQSSVGWLQPKPVTAMHDEARKTFQKKHTHTKGFANQSFFTHSFSSAHFPDELQKSFAFLSCVDNCLVS
jgi:hypothetical protein